MLIEFSVGNFRSIKDVQTISFVATDIESSEANKSVDENNIVDTGDLKLLKTVGIYGANASGKSNVIKAFSYFIEAIKREPSSTSQLQDLFQPFLFQEKPEESECFFQVIFMLDMKTYRYGFTVKKDKIGDEIKFEDIEQVMIFNEWLFNFEDDSYIFKRNGLKIENELRNIPDLSHQHNLFLQHSSAFLKDSLINEIITYFKGSYTKGFSATSILRMVSVYFAKYKKNELLNLLSLFNINYDDIKIKEYKEDQLSVPRKNVTFYRNTLDKNIALNLETNESDGTKKLFDLAGYIIGTLDYGKYSSVVLIDEIDSNFHPSLLIKLVGLFNNPEINKSNSQLLFTTHDTNLLSPKIMRRDQFYFTEKKLDESTKVYALSDLKGIKNDADFAKQYLAGFYGGVPHLRSFLTLEKEENE